MKTALILYYDEMSYTSVGYGLCTPDEFQIFRNCLKASYAETLQQARDALNDDEYFVELLNGVYDQFRIRDNSVIVLETADFDPAFDYEDLDLSGPNPLHMSSGLEWFLESFFNIPQQSELWTKILISKLNATPTEWGHLTCESPEVIQKVLMKAGYKPTIIEGKFDWTEVGNVDQILESVKA